MTENDVKISRGNKQISRKAGTEFPILRFTKRVEQLFQREPQRHPSLVCA